MSYSQWANFVNYNFGDTVYYGLDAYQAVLENVNVVPTTLAPNWLLLPPTSSAVDTINGLTDEIVLTGVGAEPSIGFLIRGQEIGLYTTTLIQRGRVFLPNSPSVGSYTLQFATPLEIYPDTDYKVMICSTTNALNVRVGFTIRDKTPSSCVITWQAFNFVGGVFALSFNWIAFGNNPIVN